SASEPPANPNDSVAPYGGATRAMPTSTSRRDKPRKTAASNATAIPAAMAKRPPLPGYVSARPKAARHKPAAGLMPGRPEPQLNNSGSPAHQPTSAAATMVTAAKPAT